MTFQTRGLVSADGQQVRHIYSSGIGSGARVLTLSGEKLVQDLKAGERLVAADAGVVRLRAISRKTMHLRDMIRVAPDLFAGKTGATFHVAPHQPVYLRGWMARAMFAKSQVLVSASRLVDGEIYSRPQETGTIALYQLHCDTRHLVRVNGVDLATTSLSALKGMPDETVHQKISR